MHLEHLFQLQKEQYLVLLNYYLWKTIHFFELVRQKSEVRNQYRQDTIQIPMHHQSLL